MATLSGGAGVVGLNVVEATPNAAFADFEAWRRRTPGARHMEV